MLAAESIDPLSPWERGEMARADMAAEIGISERTLRWRMARDRALRERLERERAERIERDEIDPEQEYPYVPLVSDPDGDGAGYLLDSSVPKCDPREHDICNVQSGKVRIGGGGQLDNGAGGPSQRCPVTRLEGKLLVRDVNGGRPVERERPKKEPARFKPKARKGKRKRALIDT